MSSGGGSTTSTSKVQYSPQEQAARDDIAFGSQDLFRYLWEQPVNNDTIAKPVGPSGATQQSWGLNQQAIQAMMAGAAGAQRTNDNVSRGSETYNDGTTQQQVNRSNNQLLNASDVTNNPALKNAIMAAQTPIVDQFQNAGGVLSSIRNNSVGNGTFGSSRQGVAEGLATQGLARSLGEVSSKMANDAYTTGLQVQNQATNNLMGTQTDRLQLGNDVVKNQALLNMMYSQPAQLAGQQGTQQEGYQQTQNNYDAELAGNWENQRFKQLTNFANIVYGNSNGTTSTTQGIPKTDNTGQIIGTVGTAALMYMMM